MTTPSIGKAAIDSTLYPIEQTLSSLSSSSDAFHHEEGNRRAMLPNDFTPTPYSVIFSGGRQCSNSTGNRRLQIIATMFLQRYSEATSKAEKSNIVSAVMETVQDACPGDRRGAFIKFSEGRWCTVEESNVRERIGSILRDCLCTKDKSSPKAKKRPSAAQRQRQQKQKQKQNPLKLQSQNVAENSTSETEDDDEEIDTELLVWNQQLGVRYDDLYEMGDDESSLSAVFD